MTPETLSACMDHTLLKPDATRPEIIQLCTEAVELQFFSVCVNPVYVRLCKEQLRRTPVKVCSVVGFPLGAGLTRIKVEETCRAVADGADEIDMVIHIGALKDGDVEAVETDIQSVVSAAAGRPVKVIIETGLLDRDQKITACRIARTAGARFVKTSTGFAGSGATAEDVALMKKTVGNALGVKAAGGIRTLEDALKMIDAGASRIGASAGVAIMKALRQA